MQSASGTGNNVVFNSCSGAAQANGVTVQGCLNGSPTVYFDLTGTETLTLPAGGQARVEAVDGAFSNLLMGFNDVTLGMTELLPAIDTARADASGKVFFDFTFLSAHAPSTSTSFSIDGSGTNFFTITAGAGEIIDTVKVYSSTAAGDTVLFEQIRQIRVGTNDPTTVGGGGPGPGTDVPAPASLALFGAALAGLGLRRARRG